MTHSEFNKKDFEEIFLSNDKRNIIDALMFITFNFDDINWIQDKCLFLINFSENDDIKRLAMTCLGHIARIHGKIKHEQIVPVLSSYLDTNDLSGSAEDALDDIAMFTKKETVN